MRQQDLERYKERFRRETQYGAELLSYLEQSNCGTWRCEQDEADPRRWWINVTLQETVADMFDAHLEIQLVYAEYQTVEPRLLELIQRRISTNARVDHGLFMIASLDPDVDRLLRRRRGEFAAIDLHLGDLGKNSPDIRQRMSTVLSSVDHYDMSTPVHNPAGFFGRIAEFEQIVSDIKRGQSIGVFGLRKTGKTSLLNFVHRSRMEARRPVALIDVSGLSNADQFRLTLLEKSWKAVKDLGVSTKDMPRLRTLSREGELKVNIELMRLQWLSDLELLSRHANGRLEIFIDEIDQLHPDRSHLGDEAHEMLVTLTQLRGLIQSPDPNVGLVLICAGVDPAIFERPLLGGGQDNLLYKLVRLLYLAPLSRDEMAEMVRDLGRRMGVRVRQHDVIDFLFEEYGGHALLTRKACSLAVKRRRGGEIPWHMSLEDVRASSLDESDGSPFRQASEILESFAEWFPGEAELLRELWSADPEDRELAASIIAENPRQLTHAEPYGLVNSGTTEPRIRAIGRAVGAGY
ncbi:hypothetical protein [Gulosibacter sediminis]|uniref:hypothetical protein n=1 Tax=Gulosibacter sediminis TaxID=1729695 RepID=UPI001869139F|nr:hypothetical protein [Gulosibacter sediminis]